MNRIVRENYPVSKLPEDLQVDLGGVHEVRVVIEVADVIAAEEEEHPFSSFRHLARNNFKSLDEVNAHVRGLRDEWDDRKALHERLRNGS